MFSVTERIRPKVMLSLLLYFWVVKIPYACFNNITVIAVILPLKVIAAIIIERTKWRFSYVRKTRQSSKCSLCSVRTKPYDDGR